MTDEPDPPRTAVLFFRAGDVSQAPCPCLLTPAVVSQISVMVMVLVIAVVSRYTVKYISNLDS